MIIKLERTIYKIPVREATNKKARSFRRGDNLNINIEDIDYPGKPDGLGGIHDYWRFRYRIDENNTFEFTVNDGISELILFESERELLASALTSAPFSVWSGSEIK